VAKCFDPNRCVGVHQLGPDSQPKLYHGVVGAAAKLKLVALNVKPTSGTAPVEPFPPDAADPLNVKLKSDAVPIVIFNDPKPANVPALAT